MNAREYYSQIETTINDCPIVTHFSTEFDEIDQFVGYLKGKLDLIDSSILHLSNSLKMKMRSLTATNTNITGSQKMVS